MPISAEIEGQTAIVRLENVGKKNAITVRMRSEMQEVFQSLQDRPAVRAIVLTGAGDDFCAGADIREAGPEDIERAMWRMRLLQRMVRSVATTGKPVIAAVCGVCVGVGWSLALACDFVIAATNSRFQFAFRNIGLAPDGGVAFLLSRYVGLMRAKELLYSGRFVDGVEAQSLGLALEALPSSEVLTRAKAIAADFGNAATLALMMTKRQLDAVPGQSLDQAFEFEALIQPLMTRTDDYTEGLRAFRERRPPVYKGS
jgi:2-(1,2-epoxy-1,2-dihydrophenyl)acetyl-CoA isomerase